MPRAGLTEAAVITAALDLVDESGPRELTLGAVARRCGVATPSLYKHVNGPQRLQSLLGARVLDELTECVTQAVIGRSGADALTALMLEYRAYARLRGALV
jgi:AcrR family transcriptional regulator